MAIRTSQPPHLKRPMVLFSIGFLVYSILVVATFFATARWLPFSDEWRPFLSSVPGVVLSGFFLLLYSYIRHNDELVRQITTKSLAASSVIGLSTLLVSMTRASIGGYSEFDGATIVVAMTVTFLFVSLFLSWKHR